VTASFTMTGDITRAFPEAQIRFVYATGLRNREPWDNVESAIRGLEQRIAAGQWRPYDDSRPEIASWHDAYRRFGTNPRRFRPSVDALSRRLTSSGRLPRISGAVDAYNVVSVSHGSPSGAFDLGHVDGPIEIRFAAPGDGFTPLGDPDAVEQPNGGEVVYAQGSRVLTRHWNYRDCDQTKLTADSERVVFIIERVSAAVTTDALVAAQESLAELVRPHADDVVLGMIDVETPTTV
jgi:DNA/RNA-binding domain of Phe-tRNA-synthetase-like protein